MDIYFAGCVPGVVDEVLDRRTFKRLLQGQDVKILWASERELIVNVDGAVTSFSSQSRTTFPSDHPLANAEDVITFGNDQLGILGFICRGTTFLTAGSTAATGGAATLATPLKVDLPASHMAVTGDGRVVAILIRDSLDEPITILQFDCFEESMSRSIAREFATQDHRSRCAFPPSSVSFSAMISYLLPHIDDGIAQRQPRRFLIQSDANPKQLVADDDSFTLLLDSGEVYTWSHPGRDYGICRDPEDPDSHMSDDQIQASAAAPGEADIGSRMAVRCVQLSAAGPVTMAITRESRTVDGRSQIMPSEAYVWGPMSHSIPESTVPAWLMTEMGYQIYTSTFDAINLYARENGNEPGDSTPPESERSLITMAATGLRHSALVDAMGQVWTVGDNTDSQLGRSTTDPHADRFWGQVTGLETLSGTGEIVQVLCSSRATYVVIKNAR